MVEAWADARGHRLVESATDAELVLALVVDDGPLVAVEAQRDRWYAAGTASAKGLQPLASGVPFEAWLQGEGADGARPVLVAAAPGLVRVAWTGLEEPRGDPAAFAVSWSRLLDRCVLPPLGVCSVAERAAAGERVERGPERPAAYPAHEGAQRRGTRWLEVGLVLGALVLAGGAVLLGLGR